LPSLAKANRYTQKGPIKAHSAYYENQSKVASPFNECTQMSNQTLFDAHWPLRATCRRSNYELVLTHAGRSKSGAIIGW